MPRCYYEVLGVEQSAAPEEIRKAYRRLALEWHPDKNLHREEEATARFKELQNAFEVLQDKHERAWYDSHRDSIIRGSDDVDGKGSAPDDDLNLWPYFSPSAYSGYGDSGQGFYHVFGDLFVAIAERELRALRTRGEAGRDFPPFGSSTTPYEPVVAQFYAFWRSFATVLDFSWTDEYNPATAPNRKVRRLIDEENKRTRKRARAEYSEEVRELATFLRKRDKRVMAWQVEQKKKQAEQEEAAKKKKQQEQAAKLARALEVKEAEWMAAGAHDLDDDEDDEDAAMDEEGLSEGRRASGQKESDPLECVICSKRFRSLKQLHQHEKSKKHQAKLKELCEQMMREDAEAATWLGQASGSEGGDGGDDDDGAGSRDGEGSDGDEPHGSADGVDDDHDDDGGGNLLGGGREARLGDKAKRGGKRGEEAALPAGKDKVRLGGKAAAVGHGRSGSEKSCEEEAEVGDDDNVAGDGSNVDAEASMAGRGSRRKGRAQAKAARATLAAGRSGQKRGNRGGGGDVVGELEANEDPSKPLESSGKPAGGEEKGKGALRAGDDDEDENARGFSPIGTRLAPRDRRKQKKAQQRMRSMARAVGGQEGDGEGPGEEQADEPRAQKRPSPSRGQGCVRMRGPAKAQEKEEEEEEEKEEEEEEEEEEEADHGRGSGRGRGAEPGSGKGEPEGEDGEADDDDGEDGGGDDDDGYFLHAMLHAHSQKKKLGGGGGREAASSEGTSEDDERSPVSSRHKGTSATASAFEKRAHRQADKGSATALDDGGGEGSKGAGAHATDTLRSSTAGAQGDAGEHAGDGREGEGDLGSVREDSPRKEGPGRREGDDEAVPRVTEAVQGLSCGERCADEGGAEPDGGGVPHGSSDGDVEPQDGGPETSGGVPAADGGGMTKAQARKAKLAEKRKKKKAGAAGDVACKASAAAAAAPGKSVMACAICGFQAASRTQLFKHIAAEGHAALKYR